MAQHDKVTKYLDYYCKDLKNPGYAVMINGKWGSGKTWFVKKYLEGLDNKTIKSIYVSLYGLATTADIDYAIFQQIHPILTSKGMRLVGKVLGSLGKVVLNFDINGDEKSDGKAEISTSSLSANDFLSIKEKTIIVFDDLERCCMEIDKTLGYINYLIEHCSIKSIVVTDETEIEKNSPPTGSRYSRTREKVIGKILIAPARLDDAISAFIDETISEDVKKILHDNRRIISITHTQSSYNNLRSLRHSILDFERLYESLPDFSRKNTAFISHILRVLLILSYETRQHYITPEEITTLYGDYLVTTTRDINPNSKLRKLKGKYAPLDLGELGLSSRDWNTFFNEGFADDDVLINSISTSSFFYADNIEKWVKLWHYADLDDDTFQTTLSDVESDIRNYKYNDTGVILHLIGIFLSLSRARIIPSEPGSILTKFKNYLLHIHKSGRMSQNASMFLHSYNTSYKGLSYQAQEDLLYKEFYSFAKNISESTRNEQLKRDANNILNEIRTDLDGFINKLGIFSFDNRSIVNSPQFKHVDPHQFFCVFIKLKPNDRRRLLYALAIRYNNDPNNDLYQDELSFLHKLRQELTNYSTEHAGKLSALLCKWHVDTLNNDIIDPRSPESPTR